MAPKQFKKSNSKNETRIKIDNKNRDKTGKNYRKSTSKKSLRLKKGITNKRRQAFYLVFIYAIYVIVDSIFYEIKGEGVFDYLTGDKVLEFDLNRTQLYFKDKIGQYIGDDDKSEGADSSKQNGKNDNIVKTPTENHEHQKTTPEPPKNKVDLPELILPTHNCSTNCMPAHKVIPPMNKRPKLKPFKPNQKIFNLWGQNVSQLFVWTDEVTHQKEHKLMIESNKHVEEFWIEHQVGNPPNIPHLLDFQQDNPEQKVPEIYHYTWISCHNFTFAQYTSMLSVLQNMNNPKLARIVVTTNCPPTGEWWTKINFLAKGRILMQRIKHYDQVWGNVRLGKIVHISDVIRIMLLARYGGIFLDDDHVILQPLADQGYFNLHIPTVGVESVASLQNCFQISPPNSPIYYRWLQEYKFYENIMMGPFSVMKLWALWQKFPDEINAVQVLLVRPNWQEVKFLDKQYFDWSQHVTMHLSARFMQDKLAKRGWKFENVTDIECIDNVFGEVTRQVIMGHYERC